MFNLFALLLGNICGNMSDKIAGGKCVFCHQCVARNADPVIPEHHTFTKPRGGAGRASLNIHRSWDSGTIPAAKNTAPQTSDYDSWKLDAGALQLPTAFLGFVLISC